MRITEGSMNMISIILAVHAVVWFPDPSVMRMRGRGKKKANHSHLEVQVSAGQIPGPVREHSYLLSPPAHAHN